MVQLKEMQNMFWALVLEEGKRYSQTVEQSFHISMAALEVPTDSEALKGKHGQAVSVMVASQKSEFLICNLNVKHQAQQPLDLNFNEGEEVTFFINGQGTVHLTGYQLDDDKEFSDLDDLNDLEGESNDEEVPELVPSKKRKQMTEAEVPKKKTKWLTPGGTEFSDDSDDDSDEEDDDDDDETNPAGMFDLEALDQEGDSDDDFEIDEDDDDEDTDEEDESEEETPQKTKTPKHEQQKGKGTPVQNKNKQVPKEKQTPKQELSKTPKQDQSKTSKQDQSKTPKQDQSKTPKQDQSKTPKQDQLKTPQTGKGTQQDKTVQGQKLGETPLGKPGAGGDSGSEQSAKKKKKKKRKKNKSLENGEAGEQEQQQGAKTPQPNTPKSGQSQQQQQGAKTPQPNTPKSGQSQQQQQQGAKTPQPNTPKSGQSQQTPGKTPKKQVLAGGILAEDIISGDGQPVKKGKMAHVYYVGKFQKDGKQFDSCTSGKPFRFKLGKGEVIQGWDKGLEGMKVGGKRRLTVPPQQGYGNQRQGPIPANSTLVFEVELKNVS